MRHAIDNGRLRLAVAALILLGCVARASLAAETEPVKLLPVSEDVLKARQKAVAKNDGQLPAEKRFALSPSFIQDGKLQIVVQLASGPNAVIGELWVWESQ